MREIRIFELEHGEPAESWRLAQAMQLQVSEGELWLTMGGDADDYWLRAGESIRLAAGTRVWLSAGRDGARFVLALGGASAARSPQWHAEGVARADEARGLAAYVTQALRSRSVRWPWSPRAAQ
ncbi:hypothetical protein FHX57_004382 [Paraburkholderia tropica]|uniref:DUF2917 domain-containing protein n=1 Tax=Paraburkholderia tropica TaxID=92647 RepID=UPI001620DC3D|nr:DUF2917 domain-containing protein [Paraburkholderia tropica]MBB3002024.1 hypothetical protein [Paraburkholderia tropica]MBB6321407.1 hypothetical protein [Paraburkholderia tropica]